MARKKLKSVSVNRLARVFADVAQAGAAIESKADAVLALTRGISDAKAFDKTVREAYKVNGWNTSSGRPAAGNRKGAVPSTVKQYVSVVRAGLRAELPMKSYKTFHALRKALRDLRAKAAKKAAKRPADPKTDGVYLRQGDKLTGVPFHDLVVLYDKLANGKKAQLASAVDRLVKQFQTGVQLVLTPMIGGLRKAA